MQPEVGPVVRRERYALGILCLLAVALLTRVIMPLGIGLLLGALTAFTLQPAYQMLCRRYKRPTLWALLGTLLAAVGIGGLLVGVGYLLVERSVHMSHSLVDALQPGGEFRNLLLRLTARLNANHVPTASLVERLRDAAMGLTSSIGGAATTVASFTAHGVLLIFFLLITVFYVLRHWGPLTKHLTLILPISPRHTTALLEELRRVGRGVLMGTVATGLAQGVLAGVGFALTRVPEPLFFGALTALASLIPGFGTMLVWVPAGVWLILTHHTVLGVVELIYGSVFVVAASDYLIRPLLVSGNGEPTYLTLIALFGGVEAFGLIGLILGPVIMSLTLAVLRIYEQEISREQAAATTAAAPSATL